MKLLKNLVTGAVPFRYCRGSFYVQCCIVMLWLTCRVSGPWRTARAWFLTPVHLAGTHESQRWHLGMLAVHTNQTGLLCHPIGQHNVDYYVNCDVILYTLNYYRIIWNKNGKPKEKRLVLLATAAMSVTPPAICRKSPSCWLHSWMARRKQRHLSVNWNLKILENIDQCSRWTKTTST